MKKIVSLLAILALVFAMVAFVGCDNGNGGTPGTSDTVIDDGSDPVGDGDDETPAGETYEVVLDGTYTATENIYDNPSTQVKIATNIESLKVGDKVVLKMKGTASYEVATMEVCLVDATEAAEWWTMLDENKWTENNVTDFDIDYTYTVTQAPIGTGSDSIMIAINAKGKTDTLTLDCTPNDDDDEGEGEAGVEDVPPAEVVIWDEGLDLTASDWSQYVIVTGDKLGSTPKAIEVTYDVTYDATKKDEYISLKIGGNYGGLPLGDGTIEGASLKTGDKGALEGLAAAGTVDATFTYTPTEAEWASISSGVSKEGNANGFYLNGHGAIIKKVVLK